MAQPPPGIPILEPWETAMMEHQDRRDRMRRLSQRFGDVLIRYEEYLVQRSEHGLSEFPADIPVLRVIFDQQVFFDFNEATLKKDAFSVIDIIAESLQREPPDVALFIAGHTDSTGSFDYNHDLGLRRAEAVAVELARRGVYQGDVFRVSFGEAVPVASNRSERGRAANRRVEFLFGAHPTALAIWLESQEVAPCNTRNLRDADDCRQQVTFEVESVEVALAGGRQSVSLGGSQSVETGVRGASVGVANNRQAVAPDAESVDITAGAVRQSAEVGGANQQVSIGRQRITVDLSRRRQVVRVEH
jgi:outer membrane protein OmpA-like peptidoglycan-associated protein